MNNYFIAASLPELQVGYPPELSFQQFEQLLRDNMTAKDYAQAQVIRRFYDIQNIRRFWKGKSLDVRGNLNENALEDALLTQMGLPEYVFRYLEKYDSEESRLHHFPALIETYFSEEQERAEGFLEWLLEFEREWRLVLLGFRAKMLGRDLTHELQYEDPDDEIVAQILAQKDAKSYEPPARYEGLKVLFEEHADDPLALHKALSEYRFGKLEEAYGVAVFSLDRILAYMAQLIIAERWLELDKKQGLEIVDQIVKEAS